jgi:hypothetical protein
MVVKFRPTTSWWFIVQLHLKPERVEDWKRAVIELIDRMSQEDAFVTCLLDQRTEDPICSPWTRDGESRRWKRSSDIKMKDYRRHYEEMLADLLQAPRKAMTLRPVQAWHR